MVDSTGAGRGELPDRDLRRRIGQTFHELDGWRMGPLEHYRRSA